MKTVSIRKLDERREAILKKRSEELAAKIEEITSIGQLLKPIEEMLLKSITLECIDLTTASNENILQIYNYCKERNLAVCVRNRSTGTHTLSIYIGEGLYLGGDISINFIISSEFFWQSEEYIIKTELSKELLDPSEEMLLAD